MFTRSLLSSLLAALAASGVTVCGQQPVTTTSTVHPDASAQPVPFVGAFRAPIHSQPHEQGHGAYGTWAAGDDYKASFHDGFVFVPVLGPDYPENLPWRWRTTAVTAGGEPVAAVGPLAAVGATVHRHTDWRYEYDYGAVVEAYDVRPDGVEQTFVIAQRPRRGGDVVVTGRIESALVAEPVAAAHQQLVFRGAAGEAIVSYGKAFAFDAAGRTTPITTAFVAGDWLAQASLP